MALSHPLPASCHLFPLLAAVPDPRSAWRLVLLLVGAVVARGRRTVTSWIRAAGLSDDCRPCYTTAAGKKADRVAARLARQVVRPLVAGQPRLVVALDDTPTPRYGPHVRGAGVPHHPTPGRPAARSCTATCGWSWRSSCRTRCGASPPSRCWPACACGGRTSGASSVRTGRPSAPSWDWPPTSCGGPRPGRECWGNRRGWWPTGRTPRSRSWPP